MNNEVKEIIEYMEEFIQDDNVPKNAKNKIKTIISELKSATETDLSLKVNKLLSDLDELSNDSNLDQFTRQQLWSITSMLEGL